MCGLAGLLAYDGAPRARTQALLPALAALAHRGPDGEGAWRDEDGACALAHRRLAIVDLSSSAAQPMRASRGPATIVLNGEIYNHAALRAELEAAGGVFRTAHSDVEVALEGFLRWGIDGFLARAEGMFAFALWDGAARKLHLARDRAGEKPLYLHFAPDFVAFASEAKALVPPLGPPRELAPGVLPGYLAFMAAPAPRTLLRGIHKLPAGHRLEIGADRRTALVAWWRADRAPRPRVVGPRDVAETLRASVRARMSADVPIGLFLSGGIDSAAVARLARDAAGGPLDAFTAGYDDAPELDERAAAGEIAGTLGLRHHVLTLDPDAAIELARATAIAQDEPIADWVGLPLLALGRAARAHGVKAVLVGEGADELFCGYAGYLAAARFERRYGAWPAPLASLGAGVAGALGGVWPRAADLQRPLARLAAGEPAFWGGAIGLWPDEARDAIAAAWLEAPRDPLPAPLAALETPPDPAGWARAATAPVDGALARYLRMELRQRLPELLLMRLDKATMASAVEARAPFLDSRLLDLALDIDDAAKVGAGDGTPKLLLRAALARIVDPAALARPKIGFGVPVARWLRGKLGGVVRARLLEGDCARRGVFRRTGVERLLAEHESGRDRSVALWTLFAFAEWMDVCGVATS